MSIGGLVLVLLFLGLLVPIVLTGLEVGSRVWERTWGRNWRWMALVAIGLMIGWVIARIGNAPL